MISKGIKKREILFLALAVSLFTVVVIVGYYEGLSTQTVPAFEKIEIESVNANNNEALVITIDYRNAGTIKATVKNILIGGQPLSSYATFVDIYEASETSIKSILGGTGYVVPVGKEGRFTVVFDRYTFASGQVLDVEFDTVGGSTYSTSCRIP